MVRLKLTRFSTVLNASVQNDRMPKYSANAGHGCPGPRHIQISSTEPAMTSLCGPASQHASSLLVIHTLW